MTTPREIYSHGHHDSVLRSHRWRTAENSAGYLLPLLKPTDRLLDIGVGPGTITADLASLLTAGSVLGIDNAGTAVATTEQLARDRGLANLTVTTGNVYALDLPDDQFDVVHAHQVLQHLADPVTALSEMARVTRTGGLVGARDTDYSAFAWFPRLSGLDRWLELYEAAARANGGEPDAGRHLLSWAHAAGLTEVTTSSSTWCFATPESRTWWGEMWADRITGSTLSGQLLDERRATVDELREIADAWRDWAAAPDGVISIPHFEVVIRVP